LEGGELYTTKIQWDLRFWGSQRWKIHGFCRQVPCGDVPAGVLGGRTAAAAADLSAAGLRHAAGWAGAGGGSHGKNRWNVYDLVI